MRTSHMVMEEGIELSRPLRVSLVPCRLGRRLVSLSTWCGLLLGLLWSLGTLTLRAAFGPPGAALILCVVLLGLLAFWLLSDDYRYTLEINRGRISLLRNEATILSASLLPGEGLRLFLNGGRVHAVRCLGEWPCPIPGIPPLIAPPPDLAKLERRLAAELSALEELPRQLDLLCDPEVQELLRSRLRAEARERPSALGAELFRLAQGSCEKAAAARLVLSEGYGYSKKVKRETRIPGDEGAWYDQRT